MTFRIYSGDELVRTETLTQDIIKVGKLPSSHLRIDDDNVSRMHAVIEVTGPDEIFIIDLGSASGTVVNGKKVNKCKLQHGDEVVLGDTRVVVEIGAAGAEDEEPTMVASDAPAVAAAPPPAPSVPKPAVPNPFAAKPAAPAVPNPFAAAAAVMNPPAASGGHGGHGDEDEDPETVSYGIVASGPPVHPDEVEVGDQAVEVVVMWGDRQVLHVEHLTPFRPFYVGEPGSGPIDYLMGSEVLGTSRMPLVVSSGAGAAAVIPSGATGSVTVGDQTMTIADLRAGGKLQPCMEVPGAEQYPIPAGATVKVAHNGFTFVSKQVNAGKKIGGQSSIDWQPLMYVFGSMAVFGTLLTLMYFIPPAGGGLNLDLLNTDSRLVKYLMEPPATEEEETPEWLEEDTQQADDSGGKGKRHKGEEGAMGKKEANKTNNRYGIEGPADNQDPHMAREEAREMARNAGVLGTLRAMTGAWNSPTSPFGRDTALGNDPMSALGALMGDSIGENFGYGGLGLRGTGRGGGGTGEGTIGLGNLGTIGHGGGGGSGNGYGRGAGGFRGRDARVPQIRSGAADVRGSLSKEVIRRVIRRHINEVKFCYEQELNARPDLEGRVEVRFIISPTGSVQTAMVQSSTLSNNRVESCITQSVQRWTFPSPDGGGIVIVTYPFVLAQSGG
ncbi:MAG: AgmX/PglI C-terminal domain-containing protein [Polyangiales bacterium]|nr:AgmX/PglI C-terminal domain-containing protein [Sandaracinus sp.]MCB9621744.1 AgmX/PglI C-terminal domain-containing protein [Sandaracinus sp.]